MRRARGTNGCPTVAILYSPYNSNFASVDNFAADGEVDSQSAAARKVSEGLSMLLNEE